MNWAAIRARLATACGWTPRQSGQEVTLRQLRALFRYWETTPPLAEQGAAVLRGFKALPPIPEDWATTAGEESAERNALGGTGPVYSRAEVMAQFAAAGFAMG